MRILVLQFVPDVRGRPVPRFEPQLATLLSLLRERSHELSLLGLSRFDPAAVKAALAQSLPQLVFADISPVCVDAARAALGHIQQHEFLPIVVGGAFAAIDPSAALSLPGVHAVAIGEIDASLVTYFERIKDPAIGQVVMGVWMRDERGLARPALPPLVEELDSLPLAERELFNYAAHVGRTGEVEIAVGRGCPLGCTYCPNRTLAALYDGRGAWVRRRSPEHVLAELESLRGTYAGVRRVRFLDHAFALDPAWLDPFLAAYPPAAGLPFRCHVRAAASSPQLLDQLRSAGCDAIDVEVISGSRFIRDEVLEMETDDERIIALFEQAHARSIRTRAVVYLGAPYESEASLDETEMLLKRLRPSIVDARPYYPFPGTRAAELAREHGWIHSRGEELLHRDEPGLNIPACRPQAITASLKRIAAEFPVAAGEPWWRRWTNASKAALMQVFPRRS